MKKYLLILIICLTFCGWGECPRLGIKNGKIVNLNQKLVTYCDSLNKFK